MVLDIRGSLKTNKINKNPFVIFNELLSNSIDSYLIRKSDDKAIEPLNVKFSLEFNITKDLLDDVEFTSLNKIIIKCTDNGIGFDDDRIEAFLTLSTSYKDELHIGGITNCRGTGRLQFLHYFDKLEIESDTYNTKVSCRIDKNENQKIINDDFKRVDYKNSDIKTTITLKDLNLKTFNYVFAKKSPLDIFILGDIKQYIIETFLQRFVTLKSELGEFKIEFEIKNDKHTETNCFTFSDLPECISIKNETIPYQNCDDNYQSEIFKIQHYKISQTSDIRPSCNIVALCAKLTIVKKWNDFFNNSKELENNPIDGFYHIVLITSDYFDENVNDRRDDFDIELKNNSDIITPYISFEDINEHLKPTIDKMLCLPAWNREKVYKQVQEIFGITQKMIKEASVRIPYGDTQSRIVKRVLDSYNEKIVDRTLEIDNLKQEILALDPKNPEYRNKINEISWKHSASLTDCDRINLSQLVTRRSAVISVLDNAIKKELAIQKETHTKQQNESIIHNILFPQRKDSIETNDHDIWLLNEEYQYYDYITSDKPLSDINFNSEKLFDDKIDTEFEEIFKKDVDIHKRKRPDIAIFSEEGSVIIVELKSPDVPLDEHLQDITEYARLLAAHSRGRLKRFYGYLIGNKINKIRMSYPYTAFPQGTGYFASVPLTHHETNEQLGSLYIEVLYYDDVVKNAKNRIKVYQEKLGI